MVAYNEHTGDLMRSGAATASYRNNYDAIFGKKTPKEPEKVEEKVEDARPSSSE